MNNIIISKVDRGQVREIQQYAMTFRETLFPMLDHSIIPNDIRNFDDVYLNNDLGTFLQARDQSGNLLGVIGMMEYDHRFSYLDYRGKRTVEVARLFVEPKLRRSGLGSLLFRELQIEACKAKVEVLYLHTHPFLNGAFEYWERQGFSLVANTQEGGLTTLHMERKI